MTKKRKRWVLGEGYPNIESYRLELIDSKDVGVILRAPFEKKRIKRCLVYLEELP